MYIIMLLAVMSAEAPPGVSGLLRLRSETPEPDTIPNYFLSTTIHLSCLAS